MSRADSSCKPNRTEWKENIFKYDDEMCKHTWGDLNHIINETALRTANSSYFARTRALGDKEKQTIVLKSTSFLSMSPCFFVKIYLLHTSLPLESARALPRRFHRIKLMCFSFNHCISSVNISVLLWTVAICLHLALWLKCNYIDTCAHNKYRRSTKWHTIYELFIIATDRLTFGAPDLSLSLFVAAKRNV